MKQNTHPISNIIIFIIFLVVSTNTLAMSRKLPNEQPNPTPQPIEDHLKDATPLWESKIKAGPDWTAHVLRELNVIGKSLIETTPDDASQFCPQYKNLSETQRKDFWAFFISAMVRFESNFKTETTYQEGFRDSRGKPVVSRGLLQISIESGNAYGCQFQSTQDLHDPYQNLSCGIRILNRWMERDQRIAGKVNNSWRGGARYWSVLREGDKTSYKSILQWSQNLAICKK